MDLHVGDLLCQGIGDITGNASEVMISAVEEVIEDGDGYSGYSMIVIRGYLNPNSIGILDDDWSIYDDCIHVIERPGI